MKTNAVLVDSRDNVVTVTAKVEEGERLSWFGGELRALECIPLGHKVAIVAIAAREVVRKYGHAIGSAARAIEAGEHVHTHNLARRSES